MKSILNVKTEYSFMESVIGLDAYLARAKQLGYERVGICDNNLHAAYRFSKKAVAVGLKPVIGWTCDVQVGNRFVTLSFIAKNTVGYKQLLRLSSEKNYGETAFSQLTEKLTDVALVVPVEFSELSALTDLKFYIGVSADSPAVVTDRPFIAFPSVRYLKAEDSETLQVLQTISYSGVMDEARVTASQELLRSPQEFEGAFLARFPSALKNLEQLTETISYDLEERLQLPRFDSQKDSATLLSEWAGKGLKELLSAKKKNTTVTTKDAADEAIAQRETPQDSSVYQTRLTYELSVIHQMGFDDYFLIVADLLRFAASQGIYCGMGRGSAAGSLVAYALQITHVDPVANDLLFERFLNPERATMPDIDIDMPDNKRSELLHYMQNRWGVAHVAQIVTFSTFGKRQALRDVGKVYGLSEVEVNSLTRLTAYRFGNLQQEYDNNQRFRAEILRHPLYERIFKMAQKIEGLPRQTSVHASGVVLSEKPLVNYTALAPSDDLMITQYEAPDVEAIGLLKIDFLGLRNLTSLATMQALVKERYHTVIDPLHIDLEDVATLQLFRDGNTLGIFQFENPQMRRFLRNLAPTTFNDIVTATSIFRPGPSQFIPQFIARRHGKEAVPSMDTSIDALLKTTYGIMIYQEQVMLVGQRFAGFSLGRADSLRRAISKKKGGEFEQLQAEFVSGAVEMGHTEKKAQEIYALITRFANYGFNRSHAVAYAALAVQLTYFKAHYPDEFYQALLSDHKRQTMLADALDNGYQLVKPELNRMPYHDKVAKRKISLGFANLAGFPRDYALWIIQNRPFADLATLIKATPLQWQKSEILDPLIKVGVFDFLDPQRGKLLANVSGLIDYYQNLQTNLFEAPQLNYGYKSAPDLTLEEKYAAEQALLGVAITPHPLTAWEKRLAGHFTPLSALTDHETVTVLVTISHVRSLTTKKNERMAFLEGTDTRQTLSMVLFPESYRQALTQTSLSIGKNYLITGRTDYRNDELQLQASKLTELQETEEKLWLSVANSSKNSQIAALLGKFPGALPVILHDESTKHTTQTARYVEKSDLLMKRLAPLVNKAVYK